MNTTICGLDPRALKSALEWQAQEWVEESMIHEMARASNEPIKSCFAAAVDPEKLAEIISKLLRGCGVNADVWSPEYPTDDPSIALRLTDGSFRTVLAMPAARALALRLLQLPEGATAEDALREVEKRL